MAARHSSRLPSVHRRNKHAAVLATSQKQVRHIESIAARRLTFGGRKCLLDSYFTLHSTSSSKAFYTSEVVHHSVNPTWRNLDLRHVSANVLTSASITVRVWGRPWLSEAEDADEEFHVVVQYDIELHGLAYLRKQLNTGRPLHFEEDTVLFEMREGYYTTSLKEVAPSAEAVNELPHPMTRVNSASVHRSYSKPALERLLAFQQEIARAQASIESCRARTSELLEQRDAHEELLRTVNHARLRRSVLHDEHLVQREHVKQQEQDLLALRQTNHQRDENIQAALQQLDEHIELLKKRKRKLRQRADQANLLCSSVMLGQATKILQLHTVYPIQQTSPHVCSICNIKLPNSDFAGCDENEVAAALGYVSHLVFMIAKYLDIPLRYSVTCKCSRSTIRDDITSHLQEKEREYPLFFTKVRERKEFEVGVFLLNKNIQQLLEHCGVKMGDLRNTLPNLRMLILHFSQILTKGAAGPRSQPKPIEGKRPRSQQSLASSASPSADTSPPRSSPPKHTP